MKLKLWSAQPQSEISATLVGFTWFGSSRVRGIGEMIMDRLKLLQPTGTYLGAIAAVLVIFVLGIVAIFTFGAQAQEPRKFLAVLGGGLVICFAAYVVGALVGFLFGIPRSLEKSDETSKASEGEDDGGNTSDASRYRPNTNLEEISDWLTKILVGVGLTQLASVPDGFVWIMNLLEPALGKYPGSRAFGLGLFIFFSTSGFFITFLWARLTLPRLYVDADLSAAEERGMERGVRIGADRFLDSAERATEVGVPTETLALWVDDRPENNVRERALMERLLKLKFVNVTSTDEAVLEMKKQGTKFSLVISDMGRPGDNRAGYTLLERMKELGHQEPVVFYTSSGLRAHDVEARSRGAVGSTNSPQRLLDLVGRILQPSETS